MEYSHNKLFVIVLRKYVKLSRKISNLRYHTNQPSTVCVKVLTQYILQSLKLNAVPLIARNKNSVEICTDLLKGHLSKLGEGLPTPKQ